MWKKEDVKKKVNKYQWERKRLEKERKLKRMLKRKEQIKKGQNTFKWKKDKKENMVTKDTVKKRKVKKKV